MFTPLFATLPSIRFLGNIYVNVPTCTKTIRNSYFDLYSYGETQARSNYRMMGPFKAHGEQTVIGSTSGSVHNLFGNIGRSRRLQENSTTTNCFDTSSVYPVIEGEMKNFAMKKYAEALPPGIVVEDVKYTVKADQEVWSSGGEPCNNIRFILDQELVYSTDDVDLFTLEELAEFPFNSAEFQAELLQKFKDYETYFDRVRVAALKHTGHIL
jgi:hypothetical protein